MAPCVPVGSGAPVTAVRSKPSRATEDFEAGTYTGPEGAALRYADELQHCTRCNRHLTDATSRKFGLGPDCRQILGY